MKLTSVQRRILQESDFERRKRERQAWAQHDTSASSRSQQEQVRGSSPLDFLKEIFKVNHLVAQGLKGNPQEIYQPILPAGQESATNLQAKVVNTAKLGPHYSSDLHTSYQQTARAWAKWGEFVKQFARDYNLNRPMYNLERYPHAVSLSALKQGREPCSPFETLVGLCPF